MIMEKGCNNCRFELYNPDEIPCKDCGMDNREYWMPKPQTNADRIRAMSDECLTEKLYDAWRREADKGNDIAINWCRPGLCASEECDPDKHKACILRWLQQPAEEDTL
jgi:hypothetical protein